MRPGKPMLFGRLGHQRVLGLPGNPVSALITARIFLFPLMAKLLGKPGRELDEVPGVLTTALEANGPRQHYMRAKLEAVAGASAAVTPLPNQDSSLLAPLADANCLIVRPPNAPELKRGALVPVLRIDF
jgi:molybdopterin molybdotransferase